MAERSYLRALSMCQNLRLIAYWETIEVIGLYILKWFSSDAGRKGLSGYYGNSVIYDRLKLSQLQVLCKIRLDIIF